jgi:hypothetical protein
MNFWDELLKRVSTRADLAAVALGFVIGYVLEVKLRVLGLAAARTGVLGAGAALGFENMFAQFFDALERLFHQVFAEREEVRKATAKRVATERSVSEVDRLASELAEPSPELSKLAVRVRSDFQLWQRGLISEAAVTRSIEQFVIRYRTLRDGEVEVSLR